MNKTQLLKEIIKEIDWNLRFNVKVGSRSEMNRLRDIVVSCVGNCG